MRHGFLNRVYKKGRRGEARYVLFVPHRRKGDQAYPLILFLHGAGETGTDGMQQASVGLGPAIRKREKSFPFLTLFPQSQKRTWQANSTDARRALAILDEVTQEYDVDPGRVYLTGLSMGGYGVWDLAVAYPQRWAAIVPVCGGGDPRQAAAIKHIPCWAFHGSLDEVVRPERSRAMVEALRAAGGKPRYDEYPDVGHDSWVRAYGTAELYTWLAKQRLK